MKNSKIARKTDLMLMTPCTKTLETLSMLLAREENALVGNYLARRTKTR